MVFDSELFLVGNATEPPIEIAPSGLSPRWRIASADQRETAKCGSSKSLERQEVPSIGTTFAKAEGCDPGVHGESKCAHLGRRCA
jgi:hypothetical protein